MIVNVTEINKIAQERVNVRERKYIFPSTVTNTLMKRVNTIVIFHESLMVLCIF
jgi:hypothetical protein